MANGKTYVAIRCSHRINDVKQPDTTGEGTSACHLLYASVSSLAVSFLVPAPHPCVRVVPCLLVPCPHRHPERGVDGAPTSALFCYVARARHDLRALRRGLSRSERDLSRRSTMAIFGRGPTPPPPGVQDRSPSATCPQATRAGGGIPGLPRCGSRRSRGTPLPAPPAGSSPETPLMSEDVESIS